MTTARQRQLLKMKDLEQRRASNVSIEDEQPEYDGPCCPDPGCSGNPCTFPGYADSH